MAISDGDAFCAMSGCGKEIAVGALEAAGWEYFGHVNKVWVGCLCPEHSAAFRSGQRFKSLGNGQHIAPVADLP